MSSKCTKCGNAVGAIAIKHKCVCGCHGSRTIKRILNKRIKSLARGRK